jgi:hypothetical protein
MELKVLLAINNTVVMCSYSSAKSPHGLLNSCPRSCIHLFETHLVPTKSLIFYLQGQAAFWYNLHKNGDGIYNTRHAACPVLVSNQKSNNMSFKTV